MKMPLQYQNTEGASYFCQSFEIELSIYKFQFIL